jgi:hypothetical protein
MPILKLLEIISKYWAIGKKKSVSWTTKTPQILNLIFIVSKIHLSKNIAMYQNEGIPYISH